MRDYITHADAVTLSGQTPRPTAPPPGPCAPVAGRSPPEVLAVPAPAVERLADEPPADEEDPQAFARRMAAEALAKREEAELRRLAEAVVEGECRMSDRTRAAVEAHRRALAGGA